MEFIYSQVGCSLITRYVFQLTSHSQTDLANMRKQAPGIRVWRFRDMLQVFPFPWYIKMQMFNMLESCSHPLMKDHTVFMLMVIIILFSNPTHPSAQNTCEQYWTMLRRWLTRIRAERAEAGEMMDPVETILPQLAKCIKLLPVMLEIVPVE